MLSYTPDFDEQDIEDIKKWKEVMMSFMFDPLRTFPNPNDDDNEKEKDKGEGDDT